MRPGFIALLPALLLASAVQAGEDDAWRGDNPRNHRWDHPIIEHLEVRPDTCDVDIWNLGRKGMNVRLAGPWGRTQGWLLAGECTTFRGPPDLVRGVTTLRDADADGKRDLDRIGPYDADTLSVGLLIERRTEVEGSRRFGSFVRRMRKSLEDLGALLADVSATTPGPALERAPVDTRFRIQHVELYDRDEKKRPALFDDHPGLDLVIACDEGGPLAGFWLPQYSIGHNFAFGGDEDGKPRRGLWSAWGEQALWHELLHFRGVPDSYIFHLPKAALPGRATEDVTLPERFALGIMNSPYQAPRISALTAFILNAKHGVKQVGACEEPDHEHGHMWRWIPKRIAVEVRDEGEVLDDVQVRWWRSRPMENLGDDRRQGIPEGTPPDVDGSQEVESTLLGRTDPRPQRSLFLLVEVWHLGATRWEVIRLLELNEAWAAGHRERYTYVLDWDAMRRVRR